MAILAALAGVFGTAFIVGLSGSMMPGPMLAVAVSETPRQGPLTGPKMIVGHALLEAALVAAVAAGLAPFLQDSTVIGVVGLAGGAMLLWMGQDMVRSAKKLSLQTDPAAAGKRSLIAAGIITSISNPLWTVWWATIGLSYIAMGLKFGLAGLAAFFAGHIISDFAWFGFVSYGISRGRRLMSDRLYQRLIIACGAALIIFGGWFFYAGFKAFA